MRKIVSSVNNGLPYTLAVNQPRENDADIPELYGSVAESHSHSPVFETVPESIEARNFPFMTWTYSNHQIKCDVVCVAVPMITGSEDIKYVLSEDGMTLFVEYVWPPVLLNPRTLFKNVTLENGARISMEHPKVYAYQNRLAEIELSTKSRPGASLIIPLPIRVQRELGTYRSQALECGDTEIVMIDFTAFQNKKVISDADNNIAFSRHRNE